MKSLLLFAGFVFILLLTACGDKGSAPVITVLGKNPATTGVGNTYTDAGATAFDEEDGDITSAIVADNRVDTSQPGTYYVLYDVTDSDGNKAEQARREVVVKYF